VIVLVSLQLGIKLCKIPTLKALWDEEVKQRRKLAIGDLGSSSGDLKRWLERIPQLKPYTEQFQEAGLTAEAMLAVQSDAQLAESGARIDNEVDKYCLLLNLARVRAYRCEHSRTSSLDARLNADLPLSRQGFLRSVSRSSSKTRKPKAAHSRMLGTVEMEQVDSSVLPRWAEMGGVPTGVC